MRADGVFVWVDVVSDQAKVRPGDTPYRVVRMRDIDAQVRRSRSLERQVEVDQLTGALSRAKGLAVLTQVLHAPSRASLALAFADIDDFKSVNDSLGHQAGDRILAHVARCIRSSVRHVDTVIRLGGDEFLIAMVGVDDAAQAMRLAQAAGDAVRQPIRLGDSMVTPTVSMGVTLAVDGDDLGSLIERADQAMYAAKARGPGRSCLAG